MWQSGNEVEREHCWGYFLIKFGFTDKMTYGDGPSLFLLVSDANKRSECHSCFMVMGYVISLRIEA